MRTRMGVERASVLAICIVGAVACSDSGDKGNDTLPDGATVTPGTDAGTTTLDGGSIDSGLIGRDATVLADGAVVVESPDAGGPGPVEATDSSTPLPCNGSCDDGVDCTIDSCKNDACEHRVDNGFCAAGSSCSLTMGCQQGKACANDMDCADSDGCTTREVCNTTLARCEYDVLDRDGDGYPPVSCGGTDCDDNHGLVNPSASETCNGVDDDCDGTVDDNLTPVTGYTCKNGEVGCSEGYQLCGATCVDTMNDPTSCGGCGGPDSVCTTGEACVMGTCTCKQGPTIMMCGQGMNTACSDISKSQANCGGCDMPCAPLAMGGQAQSCIASACTACGGEGQTCCDPNQFPVLPNGCAPGLSCGGTAGSADAKCVCGEGSTNCGDGCADLTTSNANCGMCGNACAGGETCVTAGGMTACEPCGRLGEVCCERFGIAVCGGGLACGPDDTCVLGNAGGPGNMFGPGNGGGPGGN